MKVLGIAEVELVSVLRKKLEKERDDIEWAGLQMIQGSRVW